MTAHGKLQSKKIRQNRASSKATNYFVCSHQSNVRSKQRQIKHEFEEVEILKISSLLN